MPDEVRKPAPRRRKGLDIQARYLSLCERLYDYLKDGEKEMYLRWRRLPKDMTEDTLKILEGGGPGNMLNQGTSVTKWEDLGADRIEMQALAKSLPQVWSVSAEEWLMSKM